MLRDREELVRRLKAKPVQKAVRWYDPGVLVRVGIRDAISAVFGEYADQRLMQAATDVVSKEKLLARYNYSDLKSIPNHAGAYWVDYIADVGDGFGPTYGMAWLLAQDTLSLNNYTEKLPAGHILILGGDQCYPQATHEEYEDRFVLPYASALLPCERKDERKLFALPGNHDWYDGLGAFDSLFCQNRDPLLERNGRRIGGWRCVQHRSYWAIQLPHNWWLWGVDIQFSKYLDAAQENYFRTIVESMKGDNNIVLCIAEPHWLDSEFEGIDTVDTLHTIVRIAQKKAEGTQAARNVRIRAVLAGDWHHYSHYLLDELHDPNQEKAFHERLPLASAEAQPALKEQAIHLITAGGGGAFLHSTTDLKPQVKVSWGVRPENISEEAKAAPSHHDRGKGGAPARPRSRRFTGVADMQACYPSRGWSAVLTLKNLGFPLRNWRFSLVIGALYWIMTWQYHVVVKTAGELGDLAFLRQKINGVSYPTINAVSNQMLSHLPNVAAESIFFCLMLVGLWLGLVGYVSVSEKRTPLFKLVARFAVGSLHALAHLKAMFVLFLFCMAFNNAAVYPLLVIPLGGLVGGFIFGAYWVLTGLLARMHTGDAFGALGIRNYKNFVRMKFEKEKLTIYPIGVPKLPSTKSLVKLCRKLSDVAPPEKSPAERAPLLDIRLPGVTLIPTLGKIEPIVIWANKVRTVTPSRIQDAAE